MDTKAALNEISRRREQYMEGLISTSELWRILLAIVADQVRMEMQKLENQTQ